MESRMVMGCGRGGKGMAGWELRIERNEMVRIVNRRVKAGVRSYVGR